MKGINDLSIELYSSIFNYLSIKDLLNCRLINKKFKFLSDNSNQIYKLVIGKSDLNNNYWYYNYELIDEYDLISLKCYSIIRSLSIFNLNNNLKYLIINQFNDNKNELKIENLSYLLNLECLEIGDNYILKSNENLNLINLKIFISKIKYNRADKFHFILNTHKLERIQFNHINQIKFYHLFPFPIDAKPIIKNNKPIQFLFDKEFIQSKIKHLITSNYDYKLNKFKNLEIMELTAARCVIAEDLLVIFKNLKQLKIKILTFFEKIKKNLIEILDNKIKSNRNIDIYLEGVKLINVDKLKEFKYFKYNLEYQIKNFDLLDFNLPLIKRLDYCKLECITKFNLPELFFDKYFNLSDIRIDKEVKNVDYLRWFLSNLKRLESLTLSNVTFDSKFYYNLPNTIKELRIDNQCANLNLNYDFIFQLTELTKFTAYVNQDLFNYVFNSFYNLKYLTRFEFYFIIYVTIIKDNELFNLELNNNEHSKNLNYDQLLDTYMRIESDLNINKRKIDE